MGGCYEVRINFGQGVQDVANKRSVMRTKLGDGEIFRSVEAFPEVENAVGKEKSETGTNTDTGDKIAFFGGGKFIWTSVVAEFRMVESISHEVLKWD